MDNALDFTPTLDAFYSSDVGQAQLVAAPAGSGSIFSSLGDAVSAAASAAGLIASIQGLSDQSRNASLSRDVARTQAQASADVAKLQAQAAVAQAQRALNPPTADYSRLMLVIAVVGVVIGAVQLLGNRKK